MECVFCPTVDWIGQLNWFRGSLYPVVTTLGTLRIVQKENSRERMKMPLMYSRICVNNNVYCHAVVDW